MMKAASVWNTSRTLLLTIVWGVFALAFFWNVPVGFFFSYDQPVADKPHSSVHILGARRWLLIRVPPDFPGNTMDFLKHYKLLIDSGPNGENTNWYMPKNSCKPDSSQEIREDHPPKGSEFWFAAGLPSPDRYPKPILPPECDNAKSRRPHSALSLSSR